MQSIRDYCLFCRKAREDEMDASRRLNEMIANYGDVIPRRDYEQLQKQYEVLSFFLSFFLLWGG